jgi:hypothetical protein
MGGLLSSAAKSLAKQVAKKAAKELPIEKPSVPTLYRGIGRTDLEDKLAPREGYNVFASTDKNVARGYSGDEGEVVPFNVDATEVIEFPVTTSKSGVNPDREIRDFDKFEFDRQAKMLGEGQVLVARNVVDVGPRAKDSSATSSSDLYAIGRGTPMKPIESRSLKDQFKESLDKLGDATSIAPTPPRMFGDPKYSFLNPILEQTGRKTEDVIAEGVGEYSDVAGKRFITNKRVSNSQINPYNGPGPKFKGTLSEDDITEEQIKNLAKQLRSEDVGLLKTNLLKKDKFTVVDDKTGGQLESIGKEGNSYGIVTVAVSGVKNAPQYKKNRGMESDHIYGLHLNIEGDAALLTHKVKDARASAKKGKTVYQQPSLKPTMVGDMKGRNVIGTIKVAGRKEHPLYDIIDVDAATFSDYDFNLGGVVDNNSNLVEFDASVFEEDTLNMNAGGMSMDKQMELFEDGGDVDPVSGNDIPLGSTAEEVRDDQPAMLSEGEMVIPADVVRYFGVEHFMNLRDQAKLGYKKMEAMGQFGTEEGQTLPDDALFNAGGPPFTIEDIEIIEDEDEDIIKAADGALVPTQDDINKATDEVSTSTLAPLTRQGFTPTQAQDVIGVDNFNYLMGFYPEEFRKRMEGAEGEDQQIKEEVKNYINTNTQLDPSISGGDGVASPTTMQMGIIDGGVGGATGSIPEMYSVPSNQNIQGLKSWNENLNSPFGRAVLGFSDFMLGSIMTGAMAPGIKGVQEIAKMMDPSVKQGFKDMYSIATEQAKDAGIAAEAMEGFMSTLTPQEQQQLVMLASADNMDINVNNPNVDVYSIETTMGTQIATKGRGPLGGYEVQGPLGPEVVVPSKVNGMLSKEDLEKTRKNRDNYKKSVAEAIESGRLDRGGRPGVGKAFGPEDIGDVGKGFDIGIPSTATNFGLPDDDDIEAPNNSLQSYDYGNEGDLGFGGTPGSLSQAGLDSFDTGDDGGNMGGNSEGGGANADSVGDSMGAESPDGNDSAPGDFKRGGFVKKRKYKKKKKRRSLASR